METYLAKTNSVQKSICTKDSNAQIRNNNFDFMKIILILMILTLHYLNANMGGALNVKNIPNTSFNYYLARSLESLCIIAVNCFVLTTGFFMWQRDKINIKKVINLITIFIFYNILIYGISLAVGIVEFNKDSLRNFYRTFVQGGGWYVIIYAILYLLIPYINVIIKHITQKQFKFLLILLVVAFSLWPTFLSNVTVKDNGYGIINFIILYLIGAYISKYKLHEKIRQTYIYIYFGVYLLMALITCIDSVKGFYEHCFAYNSIFNIAGSVSFFLIFSTLTIHSNLIKKISTHTLSIYLIHVNAFINKYIWRNLLHSNQYYRRKLFIVNLGFSVITVFLVCLAIDIIREHLFKHTIDKFIDKNKIYNYEIKV